MPNGNRLDQLRALAARQRLRIVGRPDGRVDVAQTRHPGGYDLDELAALLARPAVVSELRSRASAQAGAAMASIRPPRRGALFRRKQGRFA